MRSILCFILLGFFANVASADGFPVTTEVLSGSFWVYPGEVKSINLNNWRYVQKIFVQAQSSRSSTTIEVVTNGDTKGTIYVPGTDPSYVVTIGETVRSIQFRNISNGTVQINQVQGVMSSSEPIAIRPGEFNPHCEPFTPCARPMPTPGLPGRNLGTSLSARAIYLVDILENYASYREFGIYLLPIKKVAGNAYATTAAYGDLSLASRAALLALERQIEFAGSYLDETFERDAAFQSAVELKGLGEKLEALLR